MRKVINSINLTVNYLLIAIFIVLIVAVFCQVLFRFVINQPLAWTEELSRYSLVWVTFLGAAHAMGTKSHIGMSALVDKSPLLLRRFLIVVAALVSLGFFFIMIQQGFNLVGRSMTQLSAVLRIPMGYVYLVIPISGILLAINLLDVTWQELRKGEE
ncbi:TRAP transporter small permease [Alkalihalobacterium chitinilyticum]|uniref:TRAP transporter small permease n=1 Tax=Alkalihalobacterium chitinilyticum TaxID=2980103 RepID=A0ABT5VL37_9BACI|nr:TRAP transporter small permease [Alkalihalobacterium chitinilyticum]MDE5415168.1 TRAP transporter small permease [Alkalihalobacterium chitinilyticum]